jgi:hypothetical protein
MRTFSSKDMHIFIFTICGVGWTHYVPTKKGCQGVA